MHSTEFPVGGAIEQDDMQPRNDSVLLADGDVLAILVLYERGLDQVGSWPELLRMLIDDTPTVNGRLRLGHLLVYDNSVTPRESAVRLTPRCTYVHDASNGGTAAAYRHGAQLADSLGIEWLLLVDHDTTLPRGLLERASTALSNAAPPAPVALLPWVLHGDTVVSPARITLVGTIRPLDPNTPLHPSWRLTGIASGCLIRASAFADFDTMPDGLWLDYVDHWIFAQLSLRVAPVVLIDCVLQHDLSVANSHQLSDARLKSILSAETRFVGSLPWLARVMHPWRLLARAARMARTRRDHAMTVLKHALSLRRQHD
jgi:hypothetical protein